MTSGFESDCGGSFSASFLADLYNKNDNSGTKKSSVFDNEDFFANLREELETNIQNARNRSGTNTRDLSSSTSSSTTKTVNLTEARVKAAHAKTLEIMSESISGINVSSDEDSEETRSLYLRGAGFGKMDGSVLQNYKSLRFMALDFNCLESLEPEKTCSTENSTVEENCSTSNLFLLCFNENRLENLQCLTLRGNRLVTTNGIFNNPNLMCLRALNLSHNRLEFLDGMKGSENNNSTSGFSSTIINMPQLEVLILKENSLGSRSGLYETLNPLKWDEGRFPNLTTLDLSDNALGSTSEHFGSTSEKVDISTAENKEEADTIFARIFNSTTDSISLKSLDLQGNPLRSNVRQFRRRFISALSGLIELDGKLTPTRYIVVDKTVPDGRPPMLFTLGKDASTTKRSGTNQQSSSDSKAISDTAFENNSTKKKSQIIKKEDLKQAGFDRADDELTVSWRMMPTNIPIFNKKKSSSTKKEVEEKSIDVIKQEEAEIEKSDKKSLLLKLLNSYSQEMRSFGLQIQSLDSEISNVESESENLDNDSSNSSNSNSIGSGVSKIKSLSKKELAELKSISLSSNVPRELQEALEAVYHILEVPNMLSASSTVTNKVSRSSSSTSHSGNLSKVPVFKRLNIKRDWARTVGKMVQSDEFVKKICAFSVKDMVTVASANRYKSSTTNENMTPYVTTLMHYLSELLNEEEFSADSVIGSILQRRKSAGEALATAGTNSRSSSKNVSNVGGNSTANISSIFVLTEKPSASLGPCYSALYYWLVEVCRYCNKLRFLMGLKNELKLERDEIADVQIKEIKDKCGEIVDQLRTLEMEAG